jgi:hypothetical protein
MTSVQVKIRVVPKVWLTETTMIVVVLLIGRLINQIFWLPLDSNQPERSEGD